MIDVLLEVSINATRRGTKRVRFPIAPRVGDTIRIPGAEEQEVDQVTLSPGSPEVVVVMFEKCLDLDYQVKFWEAMGFEF